MEKVILFGDEYCVCPQCKETVRYEQEMEYSQGVLVCKDCKKENTEGDKIAFDSDMRILKRELAL